MSWGGAGRTDRRRAGPRGVQEHGHEADGPRPARHAARAGTKDTKESDENAKGPAWLDPVGEAPGADTAVPKAVPAAATQRARTSTRKAEAQDALGGKVVDAFNRPAKNIFIRIGGVVNNPGGAAAAGIYTDGTATSSPAG